MSEEPDLIGLEQELRALQPARLSRALSDRLLASLPPERQLHTPAAAAPGRWDLLKWLVPSGAAVAAALVLTSVAWKTPSTRGALAAVPGLRADEVNIDRVLVSSFQTVAESPEGLPVRFELQEWQDLVTFRDTRHGVTVQRSSPRVEIVPIGYESF